MNFVLLTADVDLAVVAAADQLLAVDGPRQSVEKAAAGGKRPRAAAAGARGGEGRRHWMDREEHVHHQSEAGIVDVPRRDPHVARS